MNNWLRIEVHFHQDDELSIVEKGTLCSYEEEFYEVFTFINYAIRQLSNPGTCKATDLLASTLVAAPSLVDGLARGTPFGEARIIPHPGIPGRRRFVGWVEDQDRWSKFHFKMIGFGLLARNLGYYAPLSTLALMAYLARRHPTAEFLQTLGQSAALCGRAHLSRSIKLGNHHRLADHILATLRVVV
jgi:hypothetical protein